MQGSLFEDGHCKPVDLPEKVRNVNILLLDFGPFRALEKRTISMKLKKTKKHLPADHLHVRQILPS